MWRLHRNVAIEDQGARAGNGRSGRDSSRRICLSVNRREPLHVILMDVMIAVIFRDGLTGDSKRYGNLRSGGCKNNANYLP